MKSAYTTHRSVLRVPIAGLLAWAVPGLGHLFIGERGRGVIFMTIITLTFWSGVAIGGVKNTVNPNERSLWFLGQVCAGVYPLAAVVWGRQIDIPAGADKARWIAYGQTEDIAVIYTAIAGMLNVLVIFDVLVRAERSLAPQTRGDPGSGLRRTTS